MLVGTFLGDTGAYLGGRAFGATPMAPRISPNKTVEGLAVGILIAVAAVWFAGPLPGLAVGHRRAAAGRGASRSPRRSATCSRATSSATPGTKDTGRIFGAHGGALDRLDAVLFTVVVGYYVWLALL